MSDKKKKILIAVAAVMAVAIVVLVIVIIKINSNESEDDGSSVQTVDLAKTETNLHDNVADSSSGESTENQDGNQEVLPTEEPTPTPTPVPKEIKVVLGDYKTIEEIYTPVQITDETIESNLESLKEENTEIINLPDRPFEKGDMAIVTFKGYLGDEKIDDLTGVCLQVIIGSRIMPALIEDTIIGKKIGDNFEVDVDYPDTYTFVSEVAGKTVMFKIKLEDGFAFYVPEITDEFIRSVTEYKSLAEYRTGEKERLQQVEEKKAYEDAVTILKQKIIACCEFDGPIDDEIKKAYVLRIQKENEEIQNSIMMDAVTYYSFLYDMTPEEFQKKLMNEITLEKKFSYILNEIAKQEGITTEEAEALVLQNVKKSE